MSDTLEQAATAMNEKLADSDFSGTAKFVIEDMGAIFLDSSGARVSDDEADVTMSADAETFQGILTGEVNPTSAFMSGKLAIDGDMGTAMQLASALS